MRPSFVLFCLEQLESISIFFISYFNYSNAYNFILHQLCRSVGHTYSHTLSLPLKKTVLFYYRGKNSQTTLANYLQNIFLRMSILSKQMYVFKKKSNFAATYFWAMLFWSVSDITLHNPCKMSMTYGKLLTFYFALLFTQNKQFFLKKEAV
jgi:hypothetical protein